MMDIDEAIMHFEEQANENERLAAMGRGKPDKYAPSPVQYFRTAVENRQFATWLKELKDLREKSKPKVAYICRERKKGGTCPGNGRPCSYEICHHTTDIKYAKNFLETGDGTYAELDTWIPCSPGMKPKPFIKVLFCDMDGEIYKGYKTDKGRWYSCDNDDPIKNVVAWKFLPEPYKKEGDENDGHEM